MDERGEAMTAMNGEGTDRENRDPRERAEYIAASRAEAAMGGWRPTTDREVCPQPCEHLSQQDAREGRTRPEHPCTCTDREDGSRD